MTKNSLKDYQEGAITRDVRQTINHNFSDVSLCTTQLDVTTSTTLTNITGMVTGPLRNGVTYKFSIVIPTICTANNGSKFAFKQSVASMITSIEYDSRAYTASAVATSRGTTATDQALLYDNAAAVVTQVYIEGVLTVATGVAFEGATLQLQAAEHTSHSDTFSVFKNAKMSFEEITTG